MKEIIRRFEYLLWEKDIPDKKYVENLYQKMSSSCTLHQGAFHRK